MANDAPLTGPPVAGSEVDTLLGALERNRRTFAWKCGGLDAAGTGARLAPSSMTLGGLLKHLALVEDDMFTHALLGRPMPEPWTGVDFEADPDWEWRTGAQDDPAEVLALWEAAVARSRAAVAEALADGGLGRLVVQTRWSERQSLRRQLVDLVEEYARHTGHADLIRESVDGLVGEDAPRP
ncbi:DUF664 domain-containing protein [Nocardioides taihuensis]|uniref:DUF664 domain-containing protein n=1 Tax=Nocardioides taihuensis TaxID=1835606 RepID=A0ABW0BHA1_9ACTN